MYRYSCPTGHNIWSESWGTRWSIPGTFTHDGTWSGNWFLAMKPDLGNKLTVDWPSMSPRPNAMCTRATLRACRKDLRLAVASDTRKQVYNVSPMSLSVGRLHSEANGGLSNEMRTKCKIPLGHGTPLNRPSQSNSSNQHLHVQVWGWIISPVA